MTLSEAEQIMEKIADALQTNSEVPLHGRSYGELVNALKLMIAVEYREHADNPEEYKKAVSCYSAPMWTIAHLPGYSITKPGTTELKDEIKEMETGDSFGCFCAKQELGAMYWRQIYARLGMEWHDGLPYFDHPPAQKPPTIWERLFNKKR